MKEKNEKIAEIQAWIETRKKAAIFRAALEIKLVWVSTGKINPEDFELYTLDDIVRLLRNGETVQSIKPQMIRG